MEELERDYKEQIQYLKAELGKALSDRNEAANALAQLQMDLAELSHVDQSIHCQILETLIDVKNQVTAIQNELKNGFFKRIFGTNP